jgi:hypothetical protein
MIFCRLRRMPWNGSFATLEGHPPLDVKEDLSAETRKLWTSKEAVRTVLKEVLHAVEADGVVSYGKMRSVWAKIAQLQTFYLIKHQCEVIFNLTRGKIPRARKRKDIKHAINKFKKVYFILFPCYKMLED